MLRDLEFKKAYHKPEDDIANEFYLPALAESVNYDRAVGFFSSAVYALAWPSLKGFVEREGSIRMICSPVLSDADASALYEGYSARAEAEHSDILVREFRRLLSIPGAVKPARVLAALVALGVVEFKIAWVGPDANAKSRRLFHDKLGLFKDGDGSVVAFKGSMNETWAGLSLDGNLESVDVFLSWVGEREEDRVEEEIEYFDRLWDGSFPGVVVRPLPAVARDEIVSSADVEGWEDLVDEICVEIEATARWSHSAPSDPRTPRPHQAAALSAWKERGRRGILKHATGSGKTFTALCAIDDAVARGETPLILVPSQLLLKQWVGELRSMFGHRDLRILRCGGGHSAWRSDGLLSRWTRRTATGAPRVVVAMLQTASSGRFLNMVNQGEHLFMIADEVHRTGATEARRVLTLDAGPRLGLSATPERAGDPVGTQAILDYFSGIVPPPFTLADAIATGALTPYAYHVHCIGLTPDEQERWSEATAKIRRLFARSRSAQSDAPIHEHLRRALIRRARIVKKATEKVDAAVRVLREHYRADGRWIVYCDDQDQLREVLAAVREEFGSGVFEYHSAMTGDRERTLALFEQSGGIVVSIRCLDEGVDIPAVDSALILASSKNPREYVQRRGRVLRRHRGKSVAQVHDVLVTPQTEPDEPPGTAIVEGEIVRAIEFGRSAINPSCVSDLEQLAVRYGLDFDELRDTGVEDDGDDTTETDA